MKNKILFGALLIFAINAGAFESKEADTLGFAAVGQEIKNMDGALVGEWFLYHTNRNKYRKVKNDEFEFNDAKIEAKKDFEEKVSNYLKAYEQSYSINLATEFGEYDFANENFPLKLLTSDSYVSFSGSDDPTCGYGSSRIMFDNANETKNVLPMKKDDAKLFLQAKKDKYSGYINRTLSAKVNFNIVKNELNKLPTNAESCVSLTTMGHIKSIEIIDSKKGKIHTISFE